VKTKLKRKISRAPTRFAEAAKRSFVFVLLAALLWTWSDRAFALDVDAQKPAAAPVYSGTETFASQGASGVPFTYIDQQPDPTAGANQFVSRLWGSQLNLGLNVQSALTSSVYFSKSLPLFEALQQGLGLADDATGLLALRSSGLERKLSGGSAVQQKLNYSTGKLQLQGSYLNVDAAFAAPGGSGVTAIGDRSGADALAALRGMKELQFQLQYQPLSGMALTASHRQSVNQQPGNKQFGMTVDESAQSLVYQLGSGRQFKADYQTRGEQWQGHGPMSMRKLAAHLDASSRLALDFSSDFTDNQRDGQKEKGLTRNITQEAMAYQLSKLTRLNLNFNQTREQWDRGDHFDVTTKNISEYALHQMFGKGTKADLVYNLTSATTNGAKTDTTTTRLHFEHKPSSALNMVADWLDSQASDGTGQNQVSLALSSALGSGRGKTVIKGLYKQLSQGASNKQVDTDYQLRITSAPSRLLQLTANYESLNQQGPSADHAFVRTNLGLASQLNRFAKLTANFARETDKGTLTNSNNGVRVEINPGPLALTAGISTQSAQSQPDLRTTSADLKFKFGRPLAKWAKALTGADPLPRASAYGFRGAPTWSALGDGALTASYIGRAAPGQPGTDTRSLGYQTMLGRWAYLRLAEHTNPMVPQNNTTVLTRVRWNTYEGGLDLSHGFAALGRVIREEDLTNGSTSQSRVLGLRGGVGRHDLFNFVAGLQTTRPEGGSPTDWQFANVNLKLGRPLADWAKAASNVGIFDDDVKYGYRQLPAWASFADGGLSLQYMSRDTADGAKLIASAAGYQTMLDKRTYVKLAFQQNPLDDQAQVVAVDRKLYEVGRRIGSKFTALARYMSEDNFAESKTLRSSMLGFRGRLSEHERLETVIIVDSTTSQGERYGGTTYGLEYAREIGDGHYLVLKGTYTNNDSPGVSPEGYQIDFAFKKDI
jgi:hypothetical protein